MFLLELKIIAHDSEKNVIPDGRSICAFEKFFGRRRLGHRERICPLIIGVWPLKTRSRRAGAPLHASFESKASIPVAVHIRSRGKPLDNIT